MTITNLERTVDDTVRELKQIRDMTNKLVTNPDATDEEAWFALDVIHAIIDNLLWPN